MKKFFAALPVHAYSQNAIHGVGYTEDQALDAAVQGSGSACEDYVAEPCTERLYDFVQKYGTPRSWTERDGLQDLEDEAA